MTDTEARRLADLKRYAEDTISGKAEIGNPRWLNEQLSREWLALLERTRLTGAEQSLIEYFSYQYKGNASAVKVMALIDRLTTQPEATETLRTDISHNVAEQFRTWASAKLLAHSEPPVWQDIASAPKDGTLVWLLQRSDNSVIGPHYAYAEFNSETYSHFCLCMRPAPLPNSGGGG